MPKVIRRLWGPIFLILVIGALEGFFRAVSTPRPEGDSGPSRRFKYVFNYFGYQELDPAARDFYFQVGTEKVNYSLNSAGMRSGAELGEKIPGEFRILLLGGSSVFDITAAQAKAWPQQLELDLRRATRRNVRVLNMGMPGTGAQHAMLKALYEIDAYKPDIVIFSGAWNEFKYFHLKEPLSKLPFQVDTFAHMRLRIALKVEELCLAAARSSALLAALDLYPAKADFEAVTRAGEAPNFGYEAFPGPPLDAPRPEALEQYRESLRFFQELVRELGATPLLIQEPNYFFSDVGSPKLPATDYDTTLTRKGIRASLEASRAVMNSLAARDMPVLDFVEHFAGKNQLLSDHVHLTDAGRELLVRLLREELLPMIRKGNGR